MGARPMKVKSKHDTSFVKKFEYLTIGKDNEVMIKNAASRNQWLMCYFCGNLT